MDQLLVELQKWGCDVEGTLHRFRNNEGMILRFTRKFTQDPAVAALEADMATGNYEDAFRQAHTLKGTSGNLGLTPIYEATVSLVEALRASKNEEAVRLYPPVKEKLAEFEEILNANPQQ